MPDPKPRHPAQDPEAPEGLPSRDTKHEDESVVADLTADLNDPSPPTGRKSQNAEPPEERQRTIRQRRSRSRSHWNLDNPEDGQKPRGKSFGWIFGVAALICTTVGGILVFALSGLSFLSPNSGAPRTLQIALFHLEQGDLNTARDFITATPAEGRSGPYFYSLVTRMAIAHKDSASARQYLEEGLKIAPEDPLMLIAKAELELAIGTPEDAVTTAEKAISIDPTLNIAWRVLGQAKFSMNDPEGALEALKKSLEVAPNSVATITALVRFHVSQEDPEEASRIFRSALEEHSNPELAITYAGFLVQQGEDEAAAAAIDSALLKSPAYHRLLSFQAKLHMRSENYAGAQEALRSATVAAPKNASYWVDLGNAYAADERYLDAGNAFKRASELDPANLVPVYNLGYSLLLQKEYAEAETRLTEVLTFDPNYLLAHQSLSRLYSETFNEEKAREHREKAEAIMAQSTQQQNPDPAPQ